MYKNDIFKEIAELLNSRQEKPINVWDNYAVFLPLVYDENDNLALLYEVRARNLSTQPGEISFPGGRVEKGEVPAQAAIRETCEELGIKLNQISPLGKLDYLITPYNFAIYPYVGYLKSTSAANINEREDLDEIEKVFTVPIDYFLNNAPESYEVDVITKPTENTEFPFHLIQEGQNYQWREGKYSILFYRYEDKIIWGFTALFTANLIELAGDIFHALKK
ncbi:MAG: NUDIX hydrolase [Bacillota bacterium]